MTTEPAPEREGVGPGLGSSRDLWFHTTPKGVRPTDWRGRAALVLYVFVSITALVTYGLTTLTLVVVAFYAGLMFFLLLVRSDLFDGRLPGRPRPSDHGVKDEQTEQGS